RKRDEHEFAERHKARPWQGPGPSQALQMGYSGPVAPNHVEEAAGPSHSLLTQFTKTLGLLAVYLDHGIGNDPVAESPDPHGYIRVFTEHALGEPIDLDQQVAPEGNRRPGQHGDRVHHSLSGALESRAVVALDHSHALDPDRHLVRQRYRSDS